MYPASQRHQPPLNRDQDYKIRKVVLVTQDAVLGAGLSIRAELVIPEITVITVHSLTSSMEPPPVRVQGNLGVHFKYE